MSQHHTADAAVTPLISSQVAEAAAWDVLAELENTMISDKPGTLREHRTGTWLGKVQGALMILLIALDDERKTQKAAAA